MLVKVRTINYDGKMTTHPTSSLQCSVPKGWRELYDQLVGDLANIDRDIAVLQAKQKFGELRVYTNRLSPEAARLIEIASRVSRTTCEECGAEAKVRANRHGFYRALCEQHANDLVFR
jgi:phosphoribosylaminoimidazole carboxylase (NCAIR synthetase)